MGRPSGVSPHGVPPKRRLRNHLLPKSVQSVRRSVFPVGSKGVAGTPQVRTPTILTPADSLGLLALLSIC